MKIISFRFQIRMGAILLLLMAGSCTNSRKQKEENQKEDPPIKTPVPEGWFSLFNGESMESWEVTAFGTQGPVYVSGENFILGMGDGCTGITWTEDFPVMNYEIFLEASKRTGNDFFCGLTFPVEDTFCSLIVGGWGGPVVGLSTIDGLDGSENETRTLKKFEHDKWYPVRLKVTPKKIEAWIDQEKLIDFEYEGHDISIRPEVRLSRPLGICSWKTTAALRDIRWKKFNSSGKE